ncbi:LysR family transcriptional regulator [Telmatospirillum sp.]|uniref:LysR family transcriptional regulator n=1 Tax=Telmatospirillum sp. TaxID=2079197 RepID=UPI0028437D7F|nr:LysR family transcriptional regulator [Telmatospirillum sp.]MDR3440320.1 LysR family transcriptional regulator [Telmatospirillum sp.]
MRRNDLADLAAFIRIAEQLSFRSAASRLGVTPSALSHTMRLLEERLGVRLLNRTTRSVSLTDAGLRLQERLRPAIDQISDALEDLNEERQRPFGRLRIFTIHNIASAVIAPMWRQFLSTYPEVHLDISVNASPVDLVANGFDAGIGPRDWAAADMIAVRLMNPVKVAVVGAPSYFSQRSLPQTPDDLIHHDCIQWRLPPSDTLYEWSFERNGTPCRISPGSRLTVNDHDLTLRAAVDGLGIAYSFEAIVAPFLQSGQLVRVLEEWSPHIDGLFLYYPGQRKIPAALRAFIDMVRSAAGELA